MVGLFHALHPVTEHELDGETTSRNIFIVNLASGLWILAILVLSVALLGAELFGVFYLSLGTAMCTAGVILRLASQSSGRRELIFFISLTIFLFWLVAVSQWAVADTLLKNLYGDGYRIVLLTLTVAVLVWQRTLAHFQTNSRIDLSLHSNYFLFPLILGVGIAVAALTGTTSSDHLIFLCILSMAASTWATLLLFGRVGPSTTLHLVAATKPLFLIHGAWLLLTAMIVGAHFGPAGVASFVIGACSGLYMLMSCNACWEHFQNSTWQASAQKGFPRISRIITHSARVGFVLYLGIFLLMIVVAHRLIFPTLGSHVDDAAIVFTIFSTGGLAIATLGPAQPILLHAGALRLICCVYVTAIALAFALHAAIVPQMSIAGAALISVTMLYCVQFFLAYTVRRKLKIDTSILGWQPRGAGEQR